LVRFPAFRRPAKPFPGDPGLSHPSGAIRRAFSEGGLAANLRVRPPDPSRLAVRPQHVRLPARRWHGDLPRGGAELPPGHSQAFRDPRTYEMRIVLTRRNSSCPRKTARFPFCVRICNGCPLAFPPIFIVSTHESRTIANDRLPDCHLVADRTDDRFDDSGSLGYRYPHKSPCPGCRTQMISLGDAN
jgi:hypothetical protein